jgi:hypothetical protein
MQQGGNNRGHPRA